MPNNYVNTLTEASDALGVSINVVKEKIASVSFAPDGKQWYKDWRNANHPPNEVQAIALLYRAALAADGDITRRAFSTSHPDGGSVARVGGHPRHCEKIKYSGDPGRGEGVAEHRAIGAKCGPQQGCVHRRRDGKHGHYLAFGRLIHDFKIPVHRRDRIGRRTESVQGLCDLCLLGAGHGDWEWQRTFKRRPMP